MTNAVFTGRGVNTAGVFHERGYWENMARNARWTVYDKVHRGVDYLVGTQAMIDRRVSKVVAAERLGVEVITYHEFLGLLLGGNLSEMRLRLGVTTFRADPVPEDPPVPVNRYIDFEIGYHARFREYTGMRGEDCLVRDPNPANVVLRLSRIAREAGKTPVISWTALARSENAKRINPVEIIETGAKLCQPHGFILAECQSCKEQARIDALRAQPHPLGGTRRIINLDGD